VGLGVPRKYCKLYASEGDLADADIVPASMRLRKKHPAVNEPATSWKCACSDEVEDQTQLANTPTPLFLPNPKELLYPDDRGEQ